MPVNSQLYFGEGQEYRPEHPLPILDEVSLETPFPVETIPGLLGQTIAEIARLAQCPVSLAGGSVLAAASLLAQSFVNVALPHGEIKPTSCYFLTIAPSGERKTTADTLAMQPVENYRERLQDQYQQDYPSWKNAHRAWEIARTHLEKKSKNLSPDEIKRQLDALGEAPKVITEPILTFKEATFQTVAKIFAVGQPSLGLVSSEAGEMLGGYSFKEENQLATGAGLSSLWDDGNLQRYRVSDGFLRLDGRRMAIHAMIQPDAGLAFLNNPTLRDQGLLSRFLVSFPISKIGSRAYSSLSFTDSIVIRQYNRRYLDLISRPWPVQPDGSLTPRTVSLDDNAAKRWISFYNGIEIESSETGRFAHIQGFSSKIAQQAARLATVCAFFEDPNLEHLNEEQMLVGIMLASYYLNEISRLTNLSDYRPEEILAEKVKAWLLSKWQEDHISMSDFLSRIPIRKLRKKNKLLPIIHILVEIGLLIETTETLEIQGQTRKGGYRIVRDQS
jgi:hypothetical protein